MTSCSLSLIITWLPKYKWRHDLLHDLVSGFTMDVMHIPQGMAYGLLAGVPPVVDIYIGFFPVLLYFLFGTMPHLSMGTFAVVSILVSKPVYNLGHATHISEQTSHNNNHLKPFASHFLYPQHPNLPSLSPQRRSFNIKNKVFIRCLRALD